MMTMKNLLPSIWNRDAAPAGREEERLFFPLPAGVDPKKVQAQYKNGVLNITLQKIQEAKAKGKKIPIKAD